MSQPPSMFARLPSVPRDPILGQMEKFAADRSPGKVNLAVGMYFDDSGKIPLLACVDKARHLIETELFSNGYLPIDGVPEFREAARRLVFGQSLLDSGRRAVTMQSLGGTGALAVGAELLARVDRSRKVLISDPTWENHRSIFASAGFEVETYPYYDVRSNTVAFDRFSSALECAERGSIIVFHASCHNPTGLDLTSGEWSDVVATCAKRGLVAFVDMAYQGFGRGLEEDREPIELFTRAGVDLLVANSFSKNMSLYRERVGALHVLCEDADEAIRVQGHLKQIARARYSNPPAYGARLATRLLTDEALSAQWRAELANMRGRILSVRSRLQEALIARGVPAGASFLTQQQGMFSYTGLSGEQMGQLQSQFGIWGLDSGRICVAAINSANISAAADALSSVMRDG